MERKVLACAVAAGMLAIPASHSAIDDAGMKYTSAGEGFYGSLRTRLISVDTDGGADSTDVNASSSRLGVRGSVDLGGGLSANYRYEFSVNSDNGSSIGSTRLHNVGLSGGFGSVSFGTQWGLDYNYVWGTTDVMNFHSGNFAYTTERAGRQSNALTYYSPDFNGFDFGLGVVVDAAPDNAVPELVELLTGVDADVIQEAAGAEGIALGSEADTVDEFKVGARYSIHGFSIAGTYVAGSYTSRDGITLVTQVAKPITVSSGDVAVVIPVDEAIEATVGGRHPDGADAVDIRKSDPKSFGVALGYGQDNWSVGYYYGDTDYGAVDANGSRGWIGSEKIHSFAGQFSIDKATLRALYETKDNKIEGQTMDTDETYWTLGVQYDLGSKSRIYAEYNQIENDPGTTKDTWEIGHRVDF